MDRIVVPHLKFSASNQASGLLLAEVGQRAPHPLSTVCIAKILKALHDLHCLGIVHGDSRLDNIVLVAGQDWKWIDLGKTSHSLDPFISHHDHVSTLPASSSSCASSATATGFALSEMYNDWWVLLESICSRLKCRSQSAESHLRALICKLRDGAITFSIFSTFATQVLACITSVQLYGSFAIFTDDFVCVLAFSFLINFKGNARRCRWQAAAASAAPA